LAADNSAGNLTTTSTTAAPAKTAGTKLSIAFGKKGGSGNRRPAPVAPGFGGGGDDDGTTNGSTELVTTIDSFGLQGEGGKKEEEHVAPLVIPVPKPKWVRNKEQGGGKEPDGAVSTTATSLDDLAANLLLKEATGETMEEGSSSGTGANGEPLVIPVPAKKDVPGGGGGGTTSGKDGPMLSANAVPIPSHITDENERFRYELSLREDDIDPDSDAYKVRNEWG